MSIGVRATEDSGQGGEEAEEKEEEEGSKRIECRLV